MRYIVLALFLLGCEGFKFTAQMCESLQPGEVVRECQAYDEEAAAKASVPLYDENGKCLKCEKPEKIEIRK